jgi:hypothetical protein
MAGYAYHCRFENNEYMFIATPIEVGKTGTTTYTIKTGGILEP